MQHFIIVLIIHSYPNLTNRPREKPQFLFWKLYILLFFLNQGWGQRFADTALIKIFCDWKRFHYTKTSSVRCPFHRTRKQMTMFLNQRQEHIVFCRDNQRCMYDIVKGVLKSVSDIYSFHHQKKKFLRSW